MSFAGAHDVSIGVFAPYPGSEIYKDLVKKGVITHDEKYWQELAYVDISFTKSYCNNISTKQDYIIYLSLLSSKIISLSKWDFNAIFQGNKLFLSTFSIFDQNVRYLPKITKIISILLKQKNFKGWAPLKPLFLLPNFDTQIVFFLEPLPGFCCRIF